MNKKKLFLVMASSILIVLIILLETVLFGEITVGKDIKFISAIAILFISALWFLTLAGVVISVFKTR